MTHYKLQYEIEYNVNPEYPLSKNFGTCLGVIFDSEEKVNDYLDLLAKRGTILTTNVIALENYTPSKRVVYATTRSWE
jgi:hypothetical protein